MTPQGTDDASDSNYARQLLLTPATNAVGKTVVSVTIDDNQGGPSVTESFVFEISGAIASLDSASIDAQCQLDVSGSLSSGTYTSSSASSTWGGYTSITSSAAGISG